MKIRIYNPDKEILLELRETVTGITLCVVDTIGNIKQGGNLLKINSKGIQLCSVVNPDFGFTLTSNGKLKIY